MITNGNKFRILNPQATVYAYPEDMKFATLLTFISKGEDGLWWCETESGQQIAINPLNYTIVKEN